MVGIDNEQLETLQVEWKAAPADAGYEVDQVPLGVLWIELEGSRGSGRLGGV